MNTFKELYEKVLTVGEEKVIAFVRPPAWLPLENVDLWEKAIEIIEDLGRL